MKKQLKSQLVAAVAMCVIAAVALTSATYAWFTSIANPQVGNIDLNVRAVSAMMLSCKSAPLIANAADWSGVISSANIIDPDVGNQLKAFPAELFNVSSLFSTASPKFYVAHHNTSGILDGYDEYTVPADEDSYYSMFSLWVKSTVDGFVYLDSTSVMNAIDKVTKETITTNPKASIKYTVRVGIVPVGYDADGAGAGAVVTGEDWAHAVIWEPNSTGHLPLSYGGSDETTKLETKAVNSIVAVADPIVPATLEAATAAQTTYDFTAAGTNVTADGTGFTKSVGGAAGAITNNTSKIAMFNLEKDTMQKFNVYIWVEGADIDTKNPVADSAFRSLLKFGQEQDVFIGTFTTTP